MILIFLHVVKITFCVITTYCVRLTYSSAMYVREAWVHAPECTPTQYTNQTHGLLTRLFYGDNHDLPDEEVGILPMGFSDLMLRVRNSPYMIPQEQVVYFYNRQTIVQIFFRMPFLPRSNKHPQFIPLTRPLLS